MWGTGKGAFTNLRHRVAGFPEAEEGPRGSNLYDAPKALKALLDYETRADAEEMARQKRAAEIIGIGSKPGRKKKAPEIFLPPSEMLKLSRLRAEVEEREREQGQYIHRDKVRGTATRIYRTLNESLSMLEVRVDPNGLLSADLRMKVSELGRTALLAIHRELSDTLGLDVDDLPSGTARATSKAKRAKRAQPRR